MHVRGHNEVVICLCVFGLYAGHSCRSSAITSACAVALGGRGWPAERVSIAFVHWTTECRLRVRKKFAMIRITKKEERSRTTVTLDGQLSSDSVGVVETFCNQAKSVGHPVRLFLRDVTAVDPAGQELLTRLAAGGVRLVARGVYTSYLVDLLMSAAAALEHPHGKRRPQLC